MLGALAPASQGTQQALNWRRLYGLLSPQATTRSSPAEQSGLRLFVRNRAGPTRSCPLPVGRKGCLYLGLFQDLCRGTAFNCSEPSQLRQRDDCSRFPAKVDHLIGFTRAVIAGWLSRHGTTVPVWVTGE